MTIDGFRQTAAGVDVLVAAGRWTLRGELIQSRWTLPATHDRALAGGVRATAGWLEGRLRVFPGVDLAARAERLRFSEIATPSARQPWDSPVSRLEAGVSATPVRHVRVKFAVQRNRRPLGGRIRHDTLLAAQAGVWF